MRVLLQDAHTGLYYGQNGAWIYEPADAVNFQSIEVAGHQALASDHADLNVVLKYENPESQLALNPVYCVRRRRAGTASIPSSTAA